ncbi:dockerin type I domain-containing protein [Patescibacteria group bacterium]
MRSAESKKKKQLIRTALIVMLLLIFVLSDSVLAYEYENSPDVNNDGDVDEEDFARLKGRYSMNYKLRYDFSSDGKIDALDLAIMMNEWGRDPGPQGYSSGTARVRVDDVGDINGFEDKTSIFCLGNDYNQNYVNVRKRTEGDYKGKYQLSGGDAPYCNCTDKWPLHAYNGGNPSAKKGIWTISWSWNQNTNTTHVEMDAPGGDEDIEIDNTRMTFNFVKEGKCGGYAHSGNDSDITILEFNGDQWNTYQQCTDSQCLDKCSLPECD